MDNFALVNYYIADTVKNFQRMFSNLNKETVSKGAMLSDEQLENFVTANAQAEMAQKLKQTIADPEVSTKEQLIEAVRSARSRCLIRKNLTHVGVLQQAEEAKLYFLNMALYYAKKTEEDEETEFTAFLAGEREPDEEIVKRISAEEDYQ